MPCMDLMLVYLMFITSSRSYHNDMYNEVLSIANKGVHVFIFNMLSGHSFA